MPSRRWMIVDTVANRNLAVTVAQNQNIGFPEDALPSEVFSRIGNSLNSPFRIFATFPNPDRKLHIGTNSFSLADGSGLVLPTGDANTGYIWPETTVDFTSGVVAGGGSVKLSNLSNFSLPTRTVGSLTRMALSFISSSQIVTCLFGSPKSNASDLEDPGLLWSQMDGFPIGYVDLSCYGSGSTSATFQTIGSTSGLIENSVGSTPRIYRVGSLGGVGSGSDTTYSVFQFTATGCRIRGGYSTYEGRVLASGSGNTTLTAGKDVVVDLNEVFSRSGISSSLATLTKPSRLTLVIDLYKLSPTPSILTDNLLEVYLWDSSHLSLINASPEVIDPVRYYWIDQIYVPSGASDWSYSKAVTRPTKIHDRLERIRVIAPEISTTTVSAPPNEGQISLSHNLGGQPHVVNLYEVFSGEKRALDLGGYLIDKTPSYVTVSTVGLNLPTTSLEVECIYFPNQPNIMAPTRNFVSQWMSDSSMSIVPHTISGKENILGYEIQQWNTINNTIKNLDNRSLITNIDDQNIYLNWSLLDSESQPTETLQYRVIAGGSPVPQAILPDGYLFTKYVGRGPGSYPTLEAACQSMVDGDSILVCSSYTQTSPITITKSNITITFLGGATLTPSYPFSDGSMSPSITVQGTNVQIIRPRFKITGSGSVSSLISITGNDCYIENAYVELASSLVTVTNAFTVSSSSKRSYIRSGINTVQGILASPLQDDGYDSDIQIRGS